MASFSDLRPRARSAKAGGVVVRALRSPKLLAVSAALLLTAFFAVSELATLRGAKAHDTAAPLTRELGSPLSSASLVRTPARVSPALGGKLEIRRGGLAVTAGRDRLSLRFDGRAPWRQFANGVARPTLFGREAITFGVNRVEQSLLVARHVGAHAWRWHLSSNLSARIASDGSVRFGTSALRILPVAIFDRSGRDVTPAHARWSLREHTLVLRLDDDGLPTPYVIDPIALVAACPGGGCASATASNTTSLTITRPASVATGNLMVAQVAVRSNAALTAPAGWTTLGNQQNSGAGLEQRLYYRVATAADTAGTTYQWSWTGAVDAAGGILAYSGVDATSPFDVTPSNNSGTGTSATATGVTTTQANDMLIAFYGAQGQSGPSFSVTQDTGQGMTQEWGVMSGSSPSSKAYATSADGAQAAAGATGNRTATVGTSAQWATHLVALMPPLAVDGAGTLASSVNSVSASQTGRTITFTYTAASGGMQNGAITVVVPSGWSAPSTTAANAGYTTASTGTVSVASQTITVSNVTLAGGATMTITYGSTAGGGPGATATSSTGAQTWQAQQKARSTGTLTNLGSSPSITVYAADGAGTMASNTSSVSANQTARTITFTYTAPAGGISAGAVSVDVPSGWSAPSTTGSAAGYSTSSAGTLSVAGQTITVSSLTLAAGNTFTITYGSTASGGPGATATSTTGAQTWTTQEKSTSNGTLTAIASSPSITVFPADGAGTLSPSTTAVSASATGRTITFTYTAPAGGISNGTVTLVVPSGWSAPSTTGSAAGFTTASVGSLSVAGSTITVSALTIAAGNTFTITYGSTASGGPGATAPSSTGAQTWTTQEKSTSGGTLTDIAAQPSITIYAGDGAGTMGASISNVSASQTGRTITFTYTAPAGGISNGSVTLVVPSGWSAPSTTGSAAGYSTSSAGTLGVASQTITVSSLTLAAGSTFTITYGSTASGGPGASAPASTGAQTWQVQEKSTSAGSLTNIASSPSIAVNAADGGGTMGASIGVVSASQTGRTVTLTYTAPAGGISGGSVTLAVPSGWSAPSTTSSAAGYTTSSAGTLSAAGQTITVSSLTLAAGNPFTITYGDTGSGGPGATAAAATGAQTWQVQEKSTSGGSLTNIGSSPSITVYAADGAGTMGASIAAVSAGQTGRTITFTYTVPTGGISNGSVTLAVPSGWSAPSTTGSAAGYTTSSAGTLSVAGQTITVSSLTLAAGNTLTVTYGNTSSGGPGATAPSATGAQTWTTQEKSTAAGTLTGLATSPGITVYAADGAGTLVSGTSSVALSSTGNTLAFTYTSPAGGISNGSVTLAVPSGWSAPSTTGSAPGYSTSSAGTLTVAGSTITVSALTLAAGSTLTITYGATGSGGPGATAPSSPGAQTWQAQAKSTSAGSLANLGSSPSITVLSGDGSGALVSGTGAVNTSSTGNTITFTYTAAAGGLANGSVTLAVPNGWSAPSTTGSAGGYTTASAGSVSVASQTVTVSGVTLAGGSTLTITYGSTAGGGSGATAPATAAAQTWQAQEKSSSGGTLTNLASSPAINVNDTTAPSAPGLSFGSFTNASVTGSTVYIRTGSAGGFTVTGTSSDPESGIDHLTFPTGLGAGWSGGGQDTTSPYTGTYTFTAASAAPGGSQNVTATNGWGLTSSATAFTVVADATAPSVSAPSVTGGYATSLSVPVTKNGGTDGGSGVDAASSILERDDATLTNGTCGSFSGSWTTVTLSGGNDTTVLSGHCYEYREKLSDNVGNQGTSSPSSIAKVDNSAPSTPSLAFSGLSANAYYDGAGTLYIRPGAGGTFTVTAAASDAQSGVAGYTFGTLNSNGGANFAGSQSGDHVDYTFDGTTTAPGTARTVSAANGAGTSSANATYSIASDTTAPSVSAPSVTAGYFTSLSVPVTKNGGTDSGAGIAASSSVLERDEAALTSGTCGAFSGSWTTVTLSGGSDTTVLGGRCYEYREKLSDRVGNQGISSPSNVAKVDAQAPANNITLSSVSPAGSTLKAGSRVYYRGAATGGGSFKLTNAVTDSDSGPASSTTAALGGTTGGWSHTPSTVSTPAGGPYDSNTFTWSQGTSSAPTEVVTGTDAAGNTTAAPALTFTDDSAAPTGGALVVNGGATWSTSGSFNIDTRTDYSETQSATESGLASSTLTRAAASLTNNACGTYGSPTTIVGAPAQSLPTGCYLYTLTGTDNVGNSASVSQTVKVDTSAPAAPTFAFSNFTGTTSSSGDTVLFLPTSSGSFDITASSSDGDSGISGYAFPSAASFGTGWTVTGAGATRTYSYTPGSATPGDQTVTASNNAGLTASSTFSVIVSDTTPPTTTVQCNGAACQAGYYASAPVSVALSADDGPQGSGVDVIRYTLDGSDPTPLNGSDYVGPIDIVATTTIKFRAYDNLGNEEAVGSRLVRVDATAPTGQTIALTGAGQPYYTSTSVTFTTGNGADADSGLDLSSAQVTRETGDLAGDSCSNFAADAGTFTSPDTSVTGGHCYRYSFTIADNVGHVSTPVTATAKVDLDNPSVALSDPGSPLAGIVSLSAGASDASTGVQQVVFQRSPAGAGTWTTIGSDTTAPYTASWDTTAVGDGLYDLRAVATDTVGHTQSDVVANRRVDNTAPQTTIDSGPADPSNDATPAFNFSSSESGSSFECRIDGGSWATCTSPDTTPPLGEGTHTFDVRATDQAGNTDATPASSTWVVDLTAPDTSLSSSPSDPSNDTTPAFGLTSTETGSTFECRVDGASWAACTSPFTTPTLADGSHTFDVRATDAAGNTDATPASYAWSIDTGSPSVTITAPTTYINSSDPGIYTVTASTPDGDVTHVDFYECSNASAACSTGTWTQFDSDSTAPYTGNWTTPGADGTRAIRAVAVDAALNTGADVRTITIDRTPPSGATVSYPNGYVPGAFAVTTSNGPDADVDASTATLERETGTLTGDTCSSYSGWTAASSPDTVASGHCAVYRFRIADDAGNWSTATSPDEVKSDTAAPTSAQDDPGPNLRQAVTLTGSAGDTGGSGVASVAFERRPAGGGSWTTIATDTSSPYSVSFDTTAVSDGLYDFRTVATDVAGNSETSPAVVANRRIDNTAPSATMLSPGDPVRGTTTLTSTTSDGGSGLASVTYELAPHGGSFTTQPASWDTTLGADGLYDLRVVATDVAGNSTASAVVTTRVDNTPPALTFSSPAAGTTVSGTVALTATSSDASPATPPIGFFYKLHSDPPSAYTATGAAWNTAALPAGDGLYDLRATATDDAANTTTVENASVLVDNVPPVVAITTPAPAINGSLPSPTSLSATATDTGGSGVQQVQFFECSNQSTDCSTGVWSPVGTVAAPGPYSVSWNIPGTDGNFALAAVATDNAGHSSSDIRNVSVDRTAPDTTITGEPGDPSNAATPSFTFSSNEAGSTFECRIDGAGWTPCTSPDSLGGLNDNSHTFDVRATDPAGNTDASPATWTWHRDTTSPTGTMNNPGANIRQTVTLTSSENDPPANGYASGLASVGYEYSSDGTTWATIGTLSSAPFDSLAWNTTGVADGVYQLRIVMHDVAGNTATSATVTNVRIDNTPPTASQDDPGQYLRSVETLTGSAADSGSGVDHVDFELAPAGSGSWTAVGTDTTAPFSTNFDTATFADGHYDFRTVAYDVAGNQAASTPVSDRLVDNTPPTATLNDPGAYLRGAVGLTSSTDDPGGANASGIVSVAYEYSTNGGATWQPTGSTFDSTSIADGNVQLHVVATDAAGNSTTSAPLTKLVDNTKPSTTDDAPAGWQSSSVTVHLTGNDAGSGVNVTEYSVDGNPTYTAGTSVVIPAPADGSNDGAHTIAYFSVDNAGNIETVKSATVLIDATPPACSSCSAADYLRGTVTLSASPAADASGIKSVAFEYSPAGAGTWTTIATDTTGPAPYTAAWDTTAVADGHYDLRIVITDNADNVTTSNLPDKVVDNTSPNVATVGAPTEGQVVTGTVTVSASAADATSPVASVEFFVRGASVGTDTTAPFSFDWNTTGGPDGAATIQVVVTDMAGNTTTSAVRNVTVDNVAPTPTLADPGQNLSGTVSLSASSDPDTTQVDFERRPAGGGSWVTIASDSSLPWGTSLDTTTLADGLYDFRAVATDASGHVGTSPIRANVRVDNTAPAGSLTAPAAGSTVGGQSVTLSASASDGGSGVASVAYELRPTGGGAYTQVASSSSSPFSATWDATTVSTGSYDLRPVITDRAGNTFTGAAVTFNVDVTAPTVTLTNPGATISGTVTLNATVTGSGATSVVFAATPTGGATWTTLGTDTASPWSVSYDTTKLPDGSYDLRATVSDSLGNTAQDVVTGVRVDNLAPRVVSSAPPDGSTVTAASAISLVTSEPATPVGVTLDGGATVAPVVSGTHIDYNTGALAAGSHVLAGEVQDASGKRGPFRIHFTVGSGAVEKNTSSSSSTTVTSSDGFASATMPSGAWSSGNDWIVLKIATTAAPSGLTNGFGPGPEALDVTAYWALSGVQVHEFAQPVELVIHSTDKGLVPATFENGAWRVIHQVPTPGILPAGWTDGFWRAADGIHILTRHLSLFALLRDLEAPQAPQNVRGYLGPDGLTIRWLPGSDNSGTYDYVTVFAGSTDTGHFGPDYTAATVAGWQPGDPRIFRLQETDLAGNQSVLSAPLVELPSLTGLTLDQAAAALAKLGLTIGSVTVGGSGAAGTITGPEGLVLAPQGAAVDVTVAPGGATGLLFKVVTAPKFKPTTRKRFAARVVLSRPAAVTTQLYSPRRVRLYTWHFKVRAGGTILRLRLPRQVRRPGIYTLRWTARAGSETKTRTVSFRLIRRRAPAQRVQIVLAGTAAEIVGSSIGKQMAKLVTSIDPAFDAAANRQRDVRVVVVDADELGVAAVRDLHIVFPSTKIVALAAGPKTMTAALKAGATVALPRSTPPATLARIVRRLAGRT